MRKLLLFIPAGLIASAGLLWIGVDTYYDTRQTAVTTAKEVLSGQELFSQSEESLRRIIRHGDPKALPELKHSLVSLSLELSDYKSKNFSTDKIETFSALSERITPHLKSLQQYDTLAQSQEDQFYDSVEQIGLYELKSSVQTLDKLYKNFLKNPTEDEQLKYEAESERIKTIIAELYLDEAIEKPLITYIQNHRNYFEAITTAYRDIGYERIKRIRSNGYAIRTELQLLPSL